MKNITSVKPVLQFARKIGDFTHVHSPIIFAGIAIAGVVATVAMTSRATFKASKIIDEATTKDPDTGEEIKPTAKEVVSMTWKYCVPPILMASLTIGAIVMSHNISHKRQVALAGLYSISQDALKEYEEKVIKTVGKRKSEEAHESVIEDLLSQHPVDRSNVIVTGHGDTLCYDCWSGRYFRSNIQKVKQAMNEFNQSLLYDSCKPINELYELMDLDPIGGGEEVGWSSTKLVNFRFCSKLASDGTPVLAIDHFEPPRWSFREF